MPASIHRLSSGHTPEFTVALYGPDRPDLRSLGPLHGADFKSTYLIKSPSDQTRPGFCEYWAPQDTPALDGERFDAYKDIVLLERSRQAVVFQTADCPVVILFEAIRKRLVVCHAGRPAMTPQNAAGDPIVNVLTHAYDLLTEGLVQPLVYAKIVGFIEAEHFKHDSPEGQALVAPFDQFGDHAFKDRSLGTLDLPRLITEQLVGLHVERRHIETNGPSTFSTPWLASYRRDRSEARNAIVAVLHR